MSQTKNKVLPLVSICCITYNHEPYIKEALDGFLMQKTSFPFEVIIHDDASTDKTATIIREYQALHPDIIKPIFQNENQWSKGIKPSPTYVWPKAKGKYIALCEGDDYWTNPLKLQKQVDFLEVNSDYVICFHDVKINKNGELYDDWITKKVPTTTTIFNLIKGNYIHTPSLVFRNLFLSNKLISIPNKSPLGDYPLLLQLAQFGKIKKIEEVLCVYRYGSGLWSTREKKSKLLDNFYCYESILGMFERDETNFMIAEKYFRVGFFLFERFRAEGEKEIAKSILINLSNNVPDIFCKRLSLGFLLRIKLTMFYVDAYATYKRFIFK